MVILDYPIPAVRLGVLILFKIHELQYNKNYRGKIYFL